jgi:hypothetical protein
MKITTWTKEDVENNRKLFRAGDLRGTYGTNNTKKIERHMREHMADTIKGKIMLAKTCDATIYSEVKEVAWLGW